jgi:hypothetical protein
MLSSTPERYNDFFSSEAEARFAWALYSLARYGVERRFPGDAPTKPSVTPTSRGLFDRLHQVDLAAWASQYTQLKPAGPNKWKGRCPLHQERTPSFYVYHDDSKGWRWRCFGACASGGDIVDFYRELKQRETGAIHAR